MVPAATHNGGFFKSNNHFAKNSSIASSIKGLHENKRRLIREVVYDKMKKKMRKNKRDIH